MRHHVASPLTMPLHLLTTPSHVYIDPSPTMHVLYSDAAILYSVMGDTDAHAVLEVMGKDVVYAKNLDSKGSDTVPLSYSSLRYIPTCDI